MKTKGIKWTNIRMMNLKILELLYIISHIPTIILLQHIFMTSYYSTIIMKTKIKLTNWQEYKQITLEFIIYYITITSYYIVKDTLTKKWMNWIDIYNVLHYISLTLY